MGGGVLEMALVTEELSWGCGGIALSFGATGLGAFPILLFGNDEQKQRTLPAIAAGKKLAAFCITEADAGSDAGGIKTVNISGTGVTPTPVIRVTDSIPPGGDLSMPRTGGHPQLRTVRNGRSWST